MSALARIPGWYLGQAMRDLPPAVPGAPDQVLELDCGAWGRFRVTFAVHRPAGRRGVAPFWTPVAAEEVSPPYRLPSP